MARTRHDKTVGLVETMLRLHKDLPKAKTPHEQESLYACHLIQKED
jgi:hypothetical protein